MTGTPLDKAEPSQLFRYFAALESARFGIFTDGVRYLFFTDIDKSNVMDSRPFLTLDLTEIKSAATEAVEEVKRFVRTEFDPNAVRECAPMDSSTSKGCKNVYRWSSKTRPTTL